MVFKKWVIKRSNHYAYLGGRYFWWSFFLADSSSCSIDQKHPAAPRRFRIRLRRISRPFSNKVSFDPHLASIEEQSVTPVSSFATGAALTRGKIQYNPVIGSPYSYLLTTCKKSFIEVRIITSFLGRSHHPSKTSAPTCLVNVRTRFLTITR